MTFAKFFIAPNSSINFPSPDYRDYECVGGGVHTEKRMRVDGMKYKGLKG